MKLKLLFLLVMLTCTAGSLKSQTFSEWFKQKKTQKKYLLQQIALFGTYLGYVRKGYDITQSGLSTIRSIKSGEFNLHSLFYTSLKQVNPRIRKYPQVISVLMNGEYIARTTGKLLKEVRPDERLTSGEKDMLQSTCTNLLADVAKTIDDAIAVIMDNKLEMTDDQRLKRINEIYAYSQEQVVFTGQLAGDARMLMQQKMESGFENDFFKQLYDIK